MSGLTINIADPVIGPLGRAIVLPLHEAGRDPDDILKVLENVVLGTLLAIELIGGGFDAADRVHCGVKQRLAAARRLHPAGEEA